jgi:hypothetical protein
MKRWYITGSLAVTMLFVFGLMPLIAADVSGKVSIQTTSIAAGVGVQWGEGTRAYNGKKRPFSLQGLDVVGLGYAQVAAEGTVSNLTKLSDFEGYMLRLKPGR